MPRGHEPLAQLFGFDYAGRPIHDGLSALGRIQPRRALGMPDGIIEMAAK